MIRTQIQRQKSSSAKANALNSAPAAMGGFYLIHEAYYGLKHGGRRR